MFGALRFEIQTQPRLDLFSASALLTSVMNDAATNAIRRDRGNHTIDIPETQHLGSNPTAEVIVALLAPILRRVARRYESDRHLSSDLQQEMLIALWLSLDGFERRSSFRTWVHSVAHGVGMRHIAERRTSRQRDFVGGSGESPTSIADPESHLAIRERVLLLQSLLEKLREREREAVLLDLQEFGLYEMSDEMNISPAQVRDILTRARRRLQVWMKRTETSGVEDESENENENENAVERDLFFRPARRARPTRRGEERTSVYIIEPPRK